jgi:hypothetical protein
MPPKKAGTKKKGKGETMSLAQFQQTVTEDSGEGSWGDRMSDGKMREKCLLTRKRCRNSTSNYY